MSVKVGKPIAHFIHIGKTGGSAVKFALEPVANFGKWQIVLHPHRTRLRDIPSGEKIFFFVRDPIVRFASGFYSRQRKGLPKTFVEWRDGERRAFERFRTPRELARALARPEDHEHEAALEAFRNIQHVRDRFTFWLGKADQLHTRFDDILMVGRQEWLAADFARLLSLLQLPANVSLPSDPIAMHANPSRLDYDIDSDCHQLLRDYLADDFLIIEELRNAGLLS